MVTELKFEDWEMDDGILSVAYLGDDPGTGFNVYLAKADDGTYLVYVSHPYDEWGEPLMSINTFIEMCSEDDELGEVDEDAIGKLVADAGIDPKIVLYS